MQVRVQGLGAQDLLSPPRKQGKAWAGMNAGHSWCCSMAGASVTTLKGPVAAQQEQDTSDGVGQECLCRMAPGEADRTDLL